MALLPILVAPDPRLKCKAVPIPEVDAGIRKLMDDMLETMYAAPGIGLAAPQVGRLVRAIVVDVAQEGETPAPLCLANPEIITMSEDNFTYNEGCLSLPNQFEQVTRPAQIMLRYHDRENQCQQMMAQGLLAICIQHEIDHLDGILFVDHISSLKRNIILRRLTKQKKKNANA